MFLNILSISTVTISALFAVAWLCDIDFFLSFIFIAIRTLIISIKKHIREEERIEKAKAA